MTQQAKCLDDIRLHSPVKTSSSCSKKVNVYFTYGSSPFTSPQQSLKKINERAQSTKKRKIFQSHRKLSFKSIQSNKKRTQRLKIFAQPNRRNPIRNSHIFLKNSTISGVDTIVDQLQQFDQRQIQQNPINKKLSQLKNKQKTKRTFYSNTVKNSIKNSILLNQQYQIPRRNRIQSQPNQQFTLRRNRIQSQVLNYHYSPNPKNKSNVTIKASKQNKYYGVSKYSNGVSININQHNILNQFKSTQNVETPKYRRSAHKYMRKSFQANFIGDLQKREKQSQKKLASNYLLNPTTDRFYDQSSLQTPRLPIMKNKISYQVADPLTNSLRKQKLQRKRQKLLEQQQNLKKKNLKNRKFQHLYLLILQFFCNTKETALTSIKNTKQSCINFIKSGTCIIIMIVMLSLAIFMIQLFQ